MPSFALLLLVLLTFQSLMVWGAVAIRWRRGQPALECLPRNPSPFLPVACVAAMFFVGIMVLLSLRVTLRNTEAATTADVADLIVSVADGGIEIAVALALLTGLGRVPFSICGMHLEHAGRQLRDGGLGFFACLAPVFLVLLATYSLRTPESQHPFLRLLETHRTAEALGWLLLTAVVVAPIKEELLFRVMLQDGLARQMGAAPAIALVSVLFCAVHGFPDSLALLPLAVILGYVYDRRQSVLSVVVIHALFNLTNIVLLLLES